jgi:hypothetical protein
MMVVGLFLAIVVFWHSVGVWVGARLVLIGLLGLFVRGLGLVFARCVVFDLVDFWEGRAFIWVDSCLNACYC